MSRARYFNLSPEQAIEMAWIESQKVHRDTPYLDGIDPESAFWLGYETAIQREWEYQQPDPMEVEYVEFTIPAPEEEVDE